MDWHNIDPHNSASVNFSNRLSTLSGSDVTKGARKDRLLGGVLKNVPLAWLTEDCSLRVVSLQKDEILSSFTFCRNIYNCAGIACVEEIIPTDSPNNILLAVSLDSHHNDIGSDANANYSVVAIYSVGYNCVLSCFRLPLYVTTMKFMSADNCKRSLIQSFDGCLAVGTQEGQILVIDLYLKKLFNIYERQKSELITSNTSITECDIIDYDRPPAEIRQSYQRCLRESNEGIISHFAIRIEVVDSTCAIESLLPIDIVMGLAAGLEDGRLVVYDLIELQIFYVHKSTQNQMPLVKMDYLEPTDDPRACLYILALYDNGEELMGELHDLMYEHRAADDFGCYLENFLRGSKKLTLQLENSITSVITCQAISKLPTNDDNEDATSLFAVSWYSVLEKLNKLLIFDINQWYKEEMPSQVSLRRANRYLAGFQLKGNQCGLAAHINPATIAGFDSLQRCEEHFYPNSLSLDCSLLTSNNCMLYKWPGIQNKLLNNLREKSATLFLEPEPLFEDIRRVRLLPQFTELNFDALFSKASMCEALLGVALEHNCIGLLRDCARSWADGSFSGNHGWYAADFELNLNFLINWIWKRAAAIESRCNELCNGLLNTTNAAAAGYLLDQRSKKELGAITCQMKHLSDLMDVIVKQQRLRRSSDDDLVNTTKHESLRMAADFRNLLFWLINIGVLPENLHPVDEDDDVHDDDDVDKPTTSSKMMASSAATSSIYPYKRIRNFYVHKRAAYAKIDDKCIKKSGSCRFIFIDAFIEHECMQRSHGDIHHIEGFHTLREYWQDGSNGSGDGHGNGNGLYPPPTIISMLRIMLLPNITYESKCSILLYFFLDLHVALNDHQSEYIRDLTANLLKFSTVFQLPQHLVRNVQGFWHLDHGNFLAAVDEFSSPFNHMQNYDQWLIELQVESLLVQNVAQLAMRILDAHPNLIAPLLKLKILLANNLIAEAFHFARSKDDDTQLMQMFFLRCLKSGNLGVVRDLALNEREGQLVEQILRDSKLPGAENLHFVYLLQKSKYIEAVSYMDELSTRPKCSPRHLIAGSSIDGPDLVNTAMSTMPPVTLRSTDVYFSIKNKIKQRETQNRTPLPLSCQLIKQNANKLPGGIYRSSALSAHFASCYTDDAVTDVDEFREDDDDEQPHHQQADSINPLSARNAPFLRKPQTETHSEVVDQLTRQRVCYPKEYETIHERKRKHIEYIEPSMQDLSTRNSRTKQHEEQQPSKRLRADFEDVISDLKRLKSTRNLTLKDAGFNIIIPQQTKAIKAREIDEAAVNEEEVDTVPPLRPTNSNGLQGILKLSTPEPTTPRKQLRRGESPAVEEKTLRFALPQSPPTSMDIETPASFSKHKTTTSTLSEDSLSSHHDGGSENDEDETKNDNATKYYSVVNATATLPSSDSGISLASKPAAAKDHHNETSLLYQTAREHRESPSIFGPTPRRPLTARTFTSADIASQSSQPMKSFQTSQLSSSAVEPEAIKTGHLKTSIDTVQPIAATTNLKIVSVGTITSSEFAPSVCSSKVGEIKMSEQSTVRMAADESVGMEFKHPVHSHQKSSQQASAERQETSNQALSAATATTELDTTVGMSSADVTPMELSSNDGEEHDKSGDKFKAAMEETCENAASENEDVLSIEEIIEIRVENAPPAPLTRPAAVNAAESSSPEIVELLSSSSEDEYEGNQGDYEDELEHEGNEDDYEDDDDEEESSEETDLDDEDDENSEEYDESDNENDLPSSALDSRYDDDQIESVSDDENVQAALNVDDVETTNGQNNRAPRIESPNEHLHLALDEDENEGSNSESKLDNVVNITPAAEMSNSGGLDLQLEENEMVQQRSIENSDHQMEIQNDGAQECANATLTIDVAQKESSTNEGNLLVESQNQLENQLTTNESTLAIAAQLAEQSDLTAVGGVALELEQISEQTPTNLEAKRDDDFQKPTDNANEMSADKSQDDSTAHQKFVARTSSDEMQVVDNVELNAENPQNVELSVEVTEKNNETPKDEQAPAISSKLEEQQAQNVEQSVDVSMENSETPKEEEQPPRISNTVPDEQTLPESKTNEINNCNEPAAAAAAEPDCELKDDANCAIVPTEQPNASVEVGEPKRDITATIPVAEATDNGNREADTEDDRTKKLQVTPTKEKTPAPRELTTLESPQSNKKIAYNLRTLKSKEIDDLMLRLTPRHRKRGQSVPPQSGLIAVAAATAEDFLETDNHTPKRRSTRGISVPPQAIDGSTSSKLNEVLPMTPTTRASYATRRRRVSLAESNDSLNSPKSSRSGGTGGGRSMNIKRLHQEQAGSTPIQDSPALRTRSRLRTLSENVDGEGSDITQASTPSVDVRKRRRTSISNRSEADAGVGSGVTSTLKGRRILLKDEDETVPADDGPHTSAQSAYVETRRLTRTQRKLLHDQISIASQNSEESNVSKKHASARSHSVKNYDDDADDVASVTSSTASEIRRSNRLLRSQQVHTSNPSLDIIPEQDDMEGVHNLRAKRTRANKR